MDGVSFQRSDINCLRARRTGLISGSVAMAQILAGTFLRMFLPLRQLVLELHEA